MKKTLIVILIVTGFISCNRHDKFTISGSVNGAGGEKLYFEHSELLKTTILDSIQLPPNGIYKFRSKRPKYPDFYRLRLMDKAITFAVDSCEDITIDANSTNFATDYTVTGSATSQQIQKLRRSDMQLHTTFP